MRNLRELKLLCWWDYTDYYELLHRHVMVNRGYVLIVYRINEVTKYFPKLSHKVDDGSNGSWNLIAIIFRTIDIWCDSTVWSQLIVHSDLCETWIYHEMTT